MHNQIKVMDVRYTQRALDGTWSHVAEQSPPPRLCTAEDLYIAFRPLLAPKVKEEFWAVFMDAKNGVLGALQISVGILTASLVHPREVFGPAIVCNAAGLVLLHNHPSGDPTPSPEDEEVTRRLVAVGELIGIRVLDHIVVAERAYVSFLERGMI